jgi:hypothetical protein
VEGLSPPWIVLENFDDAKREETIGISNCFYGFHNDKASQARIWSSQKKEALKILVKVLPEKDQKFTLSWGRKTSFALILQVLKYMTPGRLRRLMNFLNLSEINRFVADKAYDTNKIRDFLKKIMFMLKFQIKEVEKLLSDLIRQFINGDIVSKIFSKN